MKAGGHVIAALNAGTATTGMDSYAYTTGTNRLASITNAAGTRTLGYDGRGNLANESRPGSVTATTVYDGHARLVSYARSDIGTLTLTYNGRDDRVTMRKSGSTRWFVYDADGRVLGEYGASAANVRAEFIWAIPEVGNENNPFGGDDGAGGYMPLAVATPNGSGTLVVNWVHGNHLGVPLVTTDATGAAASTPNDYFVPGYPGQSRVVADLYYNRYRDYDPSTGRYIQADPIGLEGGQNPFAYAGNNPMRWTDPMGLNPAAAAGLLLCEGPQIILCAAGGAALLCASLPSCRNVFVPPQTIPQDCPPDGQCKPCKTVSGRVVPVGTIGYRPLDVIPDDIQQHGVLGSHHNIFVAKQYPIQSVIASGQSKNMY